MWANSYICRIYRVKTGRGEGPFWPPPILNRVKSTGVGFDCTWSSREWKIEERVIAAVAQKTGKIIDIVTKKTYCRDCKKTTKF